MGEKQRKKQRKKQRNIRNTQQGGASKPSPIASPGTMSPVQVSSTGDDTTFSRRMDGITGCPHAERGVKLEKLRSRFQTKPLPQCLFCTRSRPSRAKAGAKKDLWICLACGHIGCGWHSPDAKDDTPLNPRFMHAKIHRNQWPHPIVMQWGSGVTLDCWCLDCDIPLMYAATDTTSARSRLLLNAAALLQECLCGQSSSKLKIESGDVKSVEFKSDAVESVEVDSGLVEEQASKASVRPFVSRRVVKGLMNLGNTCFFNSVMQNLVGVSMLREHFRQEPSVQEGLLKRALRTFFQDMDPPADGAEGGSGRTIHTRSFGGGGGSTVSPRVLFSAICTKAPRFKGFQQQDSHELLRCLLDGLHMEEESMRKSVEPSVPSGVPSEVAETFVERMFGMQLSSTVSCCACGHSSVVYEPYLDLSLPIPSKQERSKAESVRVQLPKLIAPRSQGAHASGNGVLSVHPGPLDSGVVGGIGAVVAADPKQARASPVQGCIVGPLSVLSGVAVNSESRAVSEGIEMSSASGDGKVVLSEGREDSPATAYPCESISGAVAVSACPSGSGKGDAWLDYVGEGSAGESAAMNVLGQRLACDPTASGAQDVGTGVFPSERGEDFSDPCFGDVFSMHGGGNEALDDGNGMEEELVAFGPQLPGADYRVEPKPECLDLVLFRPDVIRLPSAVPAQATSSCVEEPSSGSREVPSTSASKSEAVVPAEDEGALNGVAGLFDDEGSYSWNDSASQFKCGTDATSLSTFDSLAPVPSFASDLGQIFGGRAVSSGGVREVETYPIMSLEGCLQAFTKTEVLSGENAWGCENCTRVAHGLRDPDPSEETVDSNGGRPSPEPDVDVERPSSVNGVCGALHVAQDDVEGDVMQGEWESLVLADGAMEDLSSSTHSLSLVVVPAAADPRVELSHDGDSMVDSSASAMVDADRNGVEGSDGVAGCSSAEVAPAASVASLSKSHNVLKRSQSLDWFSDSASAHAADSPPPGCSKENEVSEESYVLVDVGASACEDDSATRNGRRRRNPGFVSTNEGQARSGKASVRGLPEGANRSVEESPKLVTVKRDATKRFLISKAPLVLTVHLKRFAQDLHGRLSKLSGHITFHEQLDLGPFIDPRDGVKRDGVYELIGTVEHSGTMRGGHYVAYVKGVDSSVDSDAGPSSDGGSTWYYISDSHVRRTSLESVLQSEAYLLFYERRTFE